MTRITIRQWPTLCEAGRSTILDAALRSGIPYPHGCRTGECGSCKSRLVSGDVAMDPYDVAALTPEEKAGGLILACRARPRTDVEVAWLGDAAAIPPRQLTARVAAIEEATHDVRIVRLEPDEPLPFAAGQYARLSFDRLPERSYSMANRPDEPTLEFHIRMVPDGVVSGYVARHLQIGDSVDLEGPFGSAHLRAEHPRPLVAAAGGTGFAPIRSIVRTALHGGWTRPIHLYLGVRDERDVYGETEMLELAARHPNLSVDVVLSSPAAETARRTGFVHGAIALDLPDLTGAAVYTAGPPPMVDAVKALARTLGADPDDIHADPFTPAAPAETLANQPSRGLLGRLWRRATG